MSEPEKIKFDIPPALEIAMAEMHDLYFKIIKSDATKTMPTLIIIDKGKKHWEPFIESGFDSAMALVNQRIKNFKRKPDFLVLGYLIQNNETDFTIEVYGHWKKKRLAFRDSYNYIHEAETGYYRQRGGVNEWLDSDLLYEKPWWKFWK